MNSQTESEDKKFRNLFNKIKLLNEITNQIVYFGVTQGNPAFSDYVDMNCGGIPEGEYEQVIDISAPFQFLSLYNQIAENRFAFSVAGLLKMNQGFFTPVAGFMKQVGSDMGIEGIETIDQAFEIFNAFVLDGMPGDESKKIILHQENQLEWELIKDNHKEAWTKAEGNLENYYKLQENFVNGLLSRSNFKFTKDGELFRIKKES